MSRHTVNPITHNCTACGATREWMFAHDGPCEPDGKPHERVDRTQFDAPRDKPFPYTHQAIDVILDIACADIFNHGTVQPETKALLDDPYAGQTINGESFDGAGYVPEMVERGAKAIYYGTAGEAGREGTWERDDGAGRQGCLDMVRAFFAAIREPTKTMDERGAEAAPYRLENHPNVPAIWPRQARDIWRAMIDQALR